MVNVDLTFGGVEGGGTQSNIVLMNGKGETISKVVLPFTTNHFLCGKKECYSRIQRLVHEALEKAGLPKNTKLAALGLCLSGCEDEDNNAQMTEEIAELYPDLAEHFLFGSDTLAPIAAACPKGGFVIISGTGSNSLLMNPDGKTYRCGGWGHLLGDEGSAYWIAHRGIKMLFDEEDNLVDPPYPTHRLRSLVLDHFGIKGRMGMLPHCYENFTKSFFASLTKKIAQMASDGDALCKQLLYDGGVVLGRYLAAVSRNVDQSLYDGPGGLSIICTGSVWNAFEHLRPGFIAGLRPNCKADKVVPRCSLLKLKISGAVGALYLAADRSAHALPRDYSRNAEVLYRYQDPNCLSLKPETPAAAAAVLHTNGVEDFKNSTVSI